MLCTIVLHHIRTRSPRRASVPSVGAPCRSTLRAVPTARHNCHQQMLQQHKQECVHRASPNDSLMPSSFLKSSLPLAICQPCYRPRMREQGLAPLTQIRIKNGTGLCQMRRTQGVSLNGTNLDGTVDEKRLLVTLSFRWSTPYQHLWKTSRIWQNRNPLLSQCPP
jgi:hypothetical protein